MGATSTSAGQLIEQEYDIKLAARSIANTLLSGASYHFAFNDLDIMMMPSPSGVRHEESDPLRQAKDCSFGGSIEASRQSRPIPTYSMRPHSRHYCGQLARSDSPTAGLAYRQRSSDLLALGQIG